MKSVCCYVHRGRWRTRTVLQVELSRAYKVVQLDLTPEIDELSFKSNHHKTISGGETTRYNLYSGTSLSNSV